MKVDVQQSCNDMEQIEKCIQVLARAIDKVKSLTDMIGVLQELRKLRTDEKHMTEDRH